MIRRRKRNEGKTTLIQKDLKKEPSPEIIER